jgi:hypothetical protein
MRLSPPSKAFINSEPGTAEAVPFVESFLQGCEGWS